MSLASQRPESDPLPQPLSRMAALIFDDRPAALRGSLQVVLAVLLGAMMGNTLNMIV